MKIGILTLPLHANYGGNLQAWALMTVLKDMGHDAWLIDMAQYRISCWRLPLAVIKRTMLKYVLRRPGVDIARGLLDQRQRALHETHARRFIADRIEPRTNRFCSTRQLIRGIGKYEFDAIVVGSDQVWRPQYTPNIEDYFLGFLGDDSRTLRFSYAASFGTDDWSFSSEQEARCAPLLRKFNAVSVREASAVTACRSRFGVDALHVIDPTLLLDADRYRNLVPEESIAPGRDKRLFVYLLDKDPAKQELLRAVVERTGFVPFDVYGKDGRGTDSATTIAPPVERWIRGFIEADLVLTDSFHGCVFSILFNKPFIAYGNPKRGLARFESLLGIFDLRNRLISDLDAVDAVLSLPPINWDAIGDVLSSEREKAMQFLVDAAKGQMHSVVR